MNLLIKSKWVAMLRGGKYPQGYGKLYNNGCYDPCGVLCALYSQEYNLAIEDVVAIDNCLVPPAVLDWSELYLEDAQLVSGINDAGNSTFAQIADFIEEWL